MFIKWRTYQRQSGGKKTDKYIQQPIIVKSGRITKKVAQKIGGDEAVERWKRDKRLQYPRHMVVMKLPSFPSCMLVHFHEPEFILQRVEWWKVVDSMLRNFPKKERKKLTVQLESIVSRVSEADEKRINVVLNDLTLHFKEGVTTKTVH